MKNIQSRRDFIRASGLNAMAAAMPAGLLSSPFALFYSDLFDPGEEFSFLKLEGIFPAYNYPQADHHSGIVPTVYWVDEMGRVIFIITGMKAFLLTAE